MATESGDDAGLDTAGDDTWLARVGRIDHDERRRLEQFGHAAFIAGTLDAAAQVTLRAQLTTACGGIESKVDVSMLTITSPTGRYEDNPAVRAMDVD